jgi:hypothetical protein
VVSDRRSRRPGKPAVNRESETWLCMLTLALVAVALDIAWSAFREKIQRRPQKAGLGCDFIGQSLADTMVFFVPFMDSKLCAMIQNL